MYLTHLDYADTERIMTEKLLVTVIKVRTSWFYYSPPSHPIPIGSGECSPVVAAKKHVQYSEWGRYIRVCKSFVLDSTKE